MMERLTGFLDMNKTMVSWQYCKDPNDINMAIASGDENWDGLTAANDIISITYDISHSCYVVFWKH